MFYVLAVTYSINYPIMSLSSALPDCSEVRNKSPPKAQMVLQNSLGTRWRASLINHHRMKRRFCADCGSSHSCPLLAAFTHALELFTQTLIIILYADPDGQPHSLQNIFKKKNFMTKGKKARRGKRPSLFTVILRNSLYITSIFSPYYYYYY